MEVNPFYADDPQEMRRLIECGVDGILTNFPDRLLDLRTRI
jgi:glycerophosphoryl diester phosphodiesterase